MTCGLNAAHYRFLQIFTEIQPHLFIFILSMTIFLLQRQSQEVVTLSGPLQKQFADPVLKS